MWESLTHTAFCGSWRKPSTAALPLALGDVRLVREAYVQIRFCRYLQTGLTVACTPGCGATEKAPWPHMGHLKSWMLVKTFQAPICYSKICMLTFPLARNICIYHPLLNEPHLSTIDHSYPSIIKTNILQISYVSASLHLQFCLVSIFYSIPSLIFFLELTVP